MDQIKYEVSTNKTFNEAVESITQSLAKRQFGVLWKLNFKDKLSEKNISFEPNFMILEVCNPHKASEVLTKHIEIGYFLPCKIVVYEHNNEVRIGYINPSFLIGLLGYGDLDNDAFTVDRILQEAVDEAKS